MRYDFIFNSCWQKILDILPILGLILQDLQQWMLLKLLGNFILDILKQQWQLISQNPRLGPHHHLRFPDFFLE